MCTQVFLLFPPGYLSFHPVSWSKVQDILDQSGRLNTHFLSPQTERNLSSLWSGILNPHRTKWGVASSLHTNREGWIFWAIMLRKSGACDLFLGQFYLVLVWFCPPYPNFNMGITVSSRTILKIFQGSPLFPSPAVIQIRALNCYSTWSFLQKICIAGFHFLFKPVCGLNEP